MLRQVTFPHCLVPIQSVAFEHVLAPSAQSGCSQGSNVWTGGVHSLQLCQVCQRRFKQKKRLSHREDNLIQEALEDDFGRASTYGELRRRPSIVDGKIKVRIDTAWHRVLAREPYMIDVLTNIHGLEKTGEDVFEKGRRAEIYYECEEGSEDLLQQWFARSRKWLSHRLGDELHLKTRPRFDFVLDGLSAKAKELLGGLREANKDVLQEESPASWQGEATCNASADAASEQDTDTSAPGAPGAHEHTEAQSRQDHSAGNSSHIAGQKSGRRVRPRPG